MTFSHIKDEVEQSLRSKVTIAGRVVLVAGFLLWAGTVTAGMWVVLNYANTPGPPADAARVWPSEVSLERTQEVATLVMFAHPRCPCTRASIGELSRIMTREVGRVTAHVLFYAPGDFEADWERTDLWDSAAEIPGVRVHRDADGNLARRLGAKTSGQVALYDASGRLAFQGGITASRGHAGDNVGSTKIRQILDGKTSTNSATSVYGCPLLGRSACGTDDRENACKL